jgi:surface protein
LLGGSVGLVIFVDPPELTIPCRTSAADITSVSAVRRDDLIDELQSTWSAVAVFSGTRATDRNKVSVFRLLVHGPASASSCCLYLQHLTSPLTHSLTYSFTRPDPHIIVVLSNCYWFSSVVCSLAHSLMVVIIMDEDDPSPTVKRQKTTATAAEEKATILDLLRSLPSNIVANYIYPFAVKVIQNREELIKAVDAHIDEFYYDEYDAEEENDVNRIHYPIDDWDVSRVDNFTCVFDLRRNLKVWHFIEDLSKWNVANGTSFARMFYGCDAFQSDLSNWDTGRATDLHSMFQDCTVFNSDLSRWNVANAIDLRGLFAGCDSFNRTYVADWPLPDDQRIELLFTE